jgi:hypothetical protein
LLSFEKLEFYYKNNFIFKKFCNNINENNYENNNLNIKLITQKLLSKKLSFSDINVILESDRTITSLLFHENIVNILTINHLDIYLKILDNYIFSDYLDRIIFQKQIWQLTEYNYIIKIFYNNYILNNNNLLKHIDISNIIFTKILTKYSSEYNNYIFIYNLLQLFLLDKKDIFILFLKYSNNLNVNNNFSYEIFNNYKILNITKLEVIRIIKYINYILYCNTKLKDIEDDEICDYQTYL